MGGIDRLPAAYATALRLRDRGSGPTEIARELDIPVESVASLLRLAEEKLAGLAAGGAERTRKPRRTG